MQSYIKYRTFYFFAYMTLISIVMCFRVTVGLVTGLTVNWLLFVACCNPASINQAGLLHWTMW